ALGAASVMWSIVPEESLYKAAQLVPLFAASLVMVGAARGLPLAARDRAGRWLAIGIALATLLVILEAVFGGVLNHLLTGAPLYSDTSLTRYKRGAAVIAMLV